MTSLGSTTFTVHVPLAVLRPVPLVADEQPSRAARLLRSVATVRANEGDAPAQYLHVDDLVEAVIVALRAHIDGVLNVSPDGWIYRRVFAGSTIIARRAGT